MSQTALVFSRDCLACFRLTGERHAMVLYPNGGAFCPNCKTYRQMRQRRAIADVLRVSGFILLVLATFLYVSLPVPHSQLMWFGFLAGYSFFLINAFQHTREVLVHG